MTVIENNHEYTGSRFEKADLSDQTIRGVVFEDCTFIRCDFSSAVAQQCRFTDCVFEQCNMSLLAVPETRFSGTEFTGTKMIGIDWTKAYWPKFDFYSQLVVKPTLQTTRDDAIFAIGDCSSCPKKEGGFVPPRAQSAHQMATRCYHNILAVLNDKPLKDYVFKDHGSLVSLSRFSTVGSLMGNLMRGNMMIEGRIARVMYISLYRMHQIALHGYIKTGLMMLVGGINRIIRPRLKLH